MDVLSCFMKALTSFTSLVEKDGSFSIAQVLFNPTPSKHMNRAFMTEDEAKQLDERLKGFIDLLSAHFLEEEVRNHGWIGGR